MTERNRNQEQQSPDKGDMSVREAGKKGGDATAATHDREFYQQIGHKGGEAGGTKGGHRVRDLVERGKEAERRDK
jgi:general stress protein YciG